MPAVTTGKVLVSGANGYVASWLVKELLDQGYTVRGTVRSETKAAPLRSFFGSYGDKFEIAIVEDITKDGAFDIAVQGIDAVMHTASPVRFTDGDPIDPAVRGTTSILASVRQTTSVRRVVITSSCAAVTTIQEEPRVFSEDDWNDAAVEVVRAMGAAAHDAFKYCASKVLAERAAWDMWHRWKDNGEVEWDLVVLNPPWVYGPPLLPNIKLEETSESVIDWHGRVVKGVPDSKTMAPRGSTYIDVRDLATVHVASIVKAAAGGERIIASAHPWTWDRWVYAAHRLFPELPAGVEDYDPEAAAYHILYVPDKEQRLLGVNFRTLEETARDSLNDFKARGWL